MAGSITGTIITMLVLMLSINIGLAFIDVTLQDLTGETSMGDLSDSPYMSYITGGVENGTSIITSDMLPEDLDSDVGDSGNIFTDTYVVLKSWIKSGSEGLQFLGSMLSQPAGFMRNQMGLPAPICLGFQIIWSMMFIILITAWIMGRS